jgi:hypothetical protein
MIKEEPEHVPILQPILALATSKMDRQENETEQFVGG